ncbi:MAG: TolC family outer membrane protein [Halofilum sp. (in: g-proteobacteria)]
MSSDRPLRATACAVVLSLSPAATLQAADLVSIYRMALQNDPTFAAAESEYQAELEARPQARAALLPQVNASASYSDNSQDTATGESDYTREQYQIELRQPLFDWAAFAGLDRADARVARAEANLAAAKQDLILRVSEAYFEVLSARDGVRFARAEKEAISRQLEQAQQRFEVGLIPVTDVKSAQASYDLAVSREIEAENALENAREALRTVIDRPPGRLEVVSDDLPLTRPEPNDVAAWVERALEQNPDFLAARADSEVARQDIQQARAGHYPEIDLYARRSDTDSSREGAFPQTDQDSTTDSIGVELSWNLFASGATSSRTDQSRSLFQAAQSRMVEARRGASQNTRDAFRGLSSAISQVEALKQAVESNEAAVEAERAGFRVGTRTAVDVLSALRDLYGAQRDYADARYNYILNRLRLKQAAGTLTVDDIRAVNAWLREAEAGNGEG